MRFPRYERTNYGVTWEEEQKNPEGEWRRRRINLENVQNLVGQEDVHNQAPIQALQVGWSLKLFLEMYMAEEMTR